MDIRGGIAELGEDEHALSAEPRRSRPVVARRRAQGDQQRIDLPIVLVRRQRDQQVGDQRTVVRDGLANRHEIERQRVFDFRRASKGFVPSVLQFGVVESAVVAG